MFGYRVPAPDEAMLISGGRHGMKDAPFRVVTGHGAFVTPMFRKVRYLTLSMQEAEVSETCVTKQGISLNVRAVIAFKVGNDSESIVNAGQRFLSDQDQMSVLTGQRDLRAATCGCRSSARREPSARRSSPNGRSWPARCWTARRRRWSPSG